jgi:hypothetical protein
VVAARNVIVMKVITLMTENLDSVSSFGQVETSIRESIKTTNEKVMARCTGQMVVAIRANGSVEFSMDMDV